MQRLLLKIVALLVQQQDRSLKREVSFLERLEQVRTPRHLLQLD
jgi:hypothetical protein